jgi:uracil-DNA glycosylase
MEIIFNTDTNTWEKTSLEDFLKDNTPSGWTDFFSRDDIIDNIITISNFLRYEASHDNITIYPSISNVFRSLYMTNIDTIDVVIIGQDPYHNGSATGLAFDAPKSAKTPPSLRNILKELQSSGFTTDSIDHLPSQGVLLINTALTVRKGSPETHMEIWKHFTTELIKYIAQYKQIVWLLMGKHAQEFTNVLSSKHKHIVIATSHPSPLSALRPMKKCPAFIGSDCFNQINKELIKIGKEPIDFSNTQ